MSDSHGDVGSYVAHALSHDERRAYEQHAHDCPTCRLEQQEFDETLAELTVLSSTPPPERLRGELMAAVRQVRPLPPVGTAPSAPRSATQSAAQSAAQSAPQVAPQVAPVVPLRPRPRVVSILTGLVAAAMVLALSLGVWVHSLGEEHRTEVAAASAESRLLSAPDAKIYLASLEGRPVSYVVSRQRSEAMMIGDQVPDPGPGKTYQLWRVSGSGAISAGLLDHGGTVRGWFVGPLSGVTQLAVTLEHSGGAQQPTLPIRSSIQL